MSGPAAKMTKEERLADLVVRRQRAIRLLTKQRKVLVAKDGEHEHQWQACRGTHPFQRERVVFDAAPAAGQSAPSRAVTVVEWMKCREWWETVAAPRRSDVAERGLGFARGWAVGRSELCDRMMCSCGEVIASPAPLAPSRISTVRVPHPALLVLLNRAAGGRRRTSSAGDGTPFDESASRLAKEIAGLVRSWTEALELIADVRDLVAALSRWGDEVDKLDDGPDALSIDANRTIVQTLERWVHELESKYDPDEIREWTRPCPALIDIVDRHDEVVGQRRCRARHTEKHKQRRSAIRVNVTRRVARCAECGTTWEGDAGIRLLAFQTDLVERMTLAEQQAEDDAARHAEALVAENFLDYP